MSPNLVGLKVHARRHLREAPFWCPACGRVFGSPRGLASHIRYSALWAWRHGLSDWEARLHMALAFLVLSTDYEHQPLRHVWRGEAEEVLGVEGP